MWSIFSIFKQKDDDKRRLERLFQELRRSKDQNIIIPFQIVKIRKSGFVVLAKGVRAFVPFTLMPWKYDKNEKWEPIAFSLKESIFYGVVCRIEKSDDENKAERFFIDASVMKLKEAVLTRNEIYKGIVIHIAQYGVLLDIGHNFQWACGSIVGFLHYTKFPDIETFKSIEIGDIIRVNYRETNEKGIEFIAVGYVDLHAKYAGTTTYAKIHKDSNGENHFTVEDKYEARLPVSISLYGENNLLIKKAINELPDGAEIHCEILDVKINSLFTLKLLSPDELIQTVQSDAHKLESSYIGKKVKVKIIREGDDIAFLVDKKYTGFLPLVGSIYHENLTIVKRIIESSPNNTIIECIVQSINVLYEVFTIIYIYPNKIYKAVYESLTPKPENVELILNERYKGFVFKKVDYGAFVDIGYHFQWKHGCIEGLLHHTKFADNESFINCKTGDIVSVHYLGENEKGRVFQDTEWMSLKDRYLGKILQLSVVRNKYGTLKAEIEGKYTAVFPVLGALYGPNKKIMKDMIQSLQDGTVVDCEVVEIQPDNRFLVKLLPQNDEKKIIVVTTETEHGKTIEIKPQTPMGD
ncbi:MAG: hypothetical protein LBE56_04770 [Tannerella sp.]|jgi:DNA-directed RNA polymerase subunit E'/Rpb7|nr:hypothetical protein [Tannerella sp.]